MLFENYMYCDGNNSVGDFQILEADNVPIQQNTYDCGIYVIQNMQHYGTNWAYEVWLFFTVLYEDSTLHITIVLVIFPVI